MLQQVFSKARTLSAAQNHPPSGENWALHNRIFAKFWTHIIFRSNSKKFSGNVSAAYNQSNYLIPAVFDSIRIAQTIYNFADFLYAFHNSMEKNRNSNSTNNAGGKMGGFALLSICLGINLLILNDLYLLDEGNKKLNLKNTVNEHIYLYHNFLQSI